MHVGWKPDITDQDEPLDGSTLASLVGYMVVLVNISACNSDSDMYCKCLKCLNRLTPFDVADCYQQLASSLFL